MAPFYFKLFYIFAISQPGKTRLVLSCCEKTSVFNWGFYFKLFAFYDIYHVLFQKLVLNLSFIIVLIAISINQKKKKV
jgi:hypothetical protein